MNIKPANEKIKKLMFVEVEKDNFFNNVQIETASGSSKHFGEILSLKYVLIRGDTTVEHLYVPDDKGNLITMAEKGYLATTYFANPHNQYNISYYVELTTNVQGDIQTAKCADQDIPKERSNGIFNLAFEPQSLGMSVVKIDASEFIFRKEATEEGEGPDTLPKYIKGMLKHSQRDLFFKTKPRNKQEIIYWPFCKNGETPVITMKARGYKEKPRTRQYVYNGPIKEWEIDLENEDFELN